jgi:uncharacterized membrane protein
MSPDTVVAGVGTGLSAGVYLAFSTMVMPALARTSPRSALRSMQRINDLAVGPVFMTIFFGAAIGSVWVLLAEWLPGGDRDDLSTIAALLSLAAFAITVGFHVPRNRRIAALNAGSAADLQAWSGISSSWARGNHLRGGCGALALFLFLW